MSSNIKVKDIGEMFSCTVAHRLNLKPPFVFLLGRSAQSGILKKESFVTLAG